MRPEIQLPGGLRKIQRIEFVSGNLESGAHAMLEVWGLGAGKT